MSVEVRLRAKADANRQTILPRSFVCVTVRRLRKETTMSTLIRFLPMVIAVLGASMPTVIEAQTPLPRPTPLPRTPPKLTMRWLDTLTVSPTNVAAGMNITGTVKLMRPAVSRIVVTLALSDSTASEEEILYGDCVSMPTRIYVEPNTDHNSFTISTLTPAAKRPSTQTGSSKTFSVTASYNNGSERASATFTVTRLCTGLWG